jgi:apolipoprotein N-acyltransferase
MVKTTAQLWRALASLLSGAILASCFPPSPSGEAAYLALVPLIVLTRFSSVRQSFFWGWISGLVLWLWTLTWLLRLADTGGPLPVVVLGWLALSAYSALYLGAFAALSARLHAALGLSAGAPTMSRTSASLRTVLLVALLPLVWVGLEYLRSTLLTGFPWNHLGVTQYRNLAAIQVAEWGGVYAVSALIMVMNAGVALPVSDGLKAFSARKRFHFELALALAACGAAWAWGAARSGEVRAAGADGETVRVVVVQPAISQLEKWNESSVDDVFNLLSAQSDLAMAMHPALMVWPETAVPGPLPGDPDSLAFVRRYATNGVPVLAGALEIEQTGSDEWRCWNSSFLVDTRGELAARYRKMHLVPFGEYIPLDRLLPFLQRLSPLGISCLPGDRMTVFSVPGRKDAAFSVLICFEDAFAGLARLAVRSGARFLVNQTNDAWFDGSAGARQHMSQCVFRCVENRVPAVRASNTGVTCFIDRNGAVSELTGARDPGAPSAGFGVYAVPTAGPLPAVTRYTRLGDAGFALPCALLAAGLLYWTVRPVALWKRWRDTGATCDVV